MLETAASVGWKVKDAIAPITELRRDYRLSTFRIFDSNLNPLLKVVRKGAPRLIPPTIMSWADSPPPTQYRLPIDDELMLLAGGNRRLGLRSRSVILTEFPTLNWDGPYRAARYYLYEFSTVGIFDDDTEYRRNKKKKHQAYFVSSVIFKFPYASMSTKSRMAI
jgi:hypothetical protein